jgi:hypothetical protein
MSNATPEQLAQLTNVCEGATFGRGQQDVLDESYRKAKKLEKTLFSSMLERDDHVPGIIDKFTHALIKTNDKVLRPELYMLNVYGMFSLSFQFA